MALKTYIPGEMSVIVGVAIINNFTSLDVEYDEDWWNWDVGSGGEATRTKNSSRLGTIKVEVPQSHESNLVMSTAANLDATVNTSVTDPNGFSAHLISEGTLTRIPNAGYAKTESGQREWNIKGILDINIVGGN